MKRSFATIAVLLLVVGAGCLGFGDQPQRSDRAEATLADAQAAVDDVNTYQYETEMHISATVEGRTLERDVTIDGEVDVAERMAVSRASTADANKSGYVANDTVYKQCSSPWGWGNETVEMEGDWVDATPLGRQIGLLESGDLRLETADQTADGDTVVLVGNPSAEALEEYGVSASQPVFGGPSVKNITVRVVVDERTHRPLRSTITFEISGGGGVGNGSVDTRFSAYDDPVSIEIPDEVIEEAGEMGCPNS